MGDLFDLRQEAEDAPEKVWFVHSLEEVERTDITLSLRLAKGYEVHGIIRRASTFNTRRLDHIYRDPHNGDQVRLYLHYGDIGSSGNLLDTPYGSAG